MRLGNFDKNTDPKLTILYVSSILLKELKKNEIIPYIELQNTVVNEVSPQAEYIMPYAISFLFLLNKIQYISELDCFKGKF